MRRGTTVRRDRELEGSARSQELAVALAMKADPELMEQLVHAVSLLDSIGGQIFIAGVREKFRKTIVVDPEGDPVERWELIKDHKEPGDYETVGYIVHWDHIATAMRGAKKEPDTTFPVDPASNGTPDLWDEQQAEVDAAIAESNAGVLPGPVVEPPAEEHEDD